MYGPGTSDAIHGKNNAESIGYRPDLQLPVAAARQSPLTSFPPLTGLRQGTRKGTSTTETYTTGLLLPDLQEVARRVHASPSAVLQAAWSKLLEVYTGSKDDINFLCILPRHCDAGNIRPPSSLTYCSFNAQNQQRTAISGIVSHFDACSSDKNPKRMGAPDAGDQHDATLLDLENLPAYSGGYQSSEKGCIHGPRYAAAVRIIVSSTSAGPLCLTASVHDSLIDGDAAQLMLAQYGHIIVFIISNLDKSMNEFCMHLPLGLLSISNPEPSVSAPFSSLQSQFEYFAEQKSQHIALEFTTQTQLRSLQSRTVWTYAELNYRAETLAADLQSRFGSLIDHVVPVCIDRCPELYVAILGVVKAGAAWCPIDPSFPSRRRHDLIARADATAVIVNAHSPQDGIPESVVTVDVTPSDPNSLKPFKKVPLAPDNLAYLIWTSGTTGAPKGVPICHRAAVASMKSLQARIPTNVKHGKVRCLQFSQFTFDVFIQDLFYTWGIGGTLISADRATMLGSFSELATKTEATHAHLTPAFAASISRKSCPTLEVVTMIGEKLTQNVADDWSDGCCLYNTYGPAETTVVSTVRLVPPKDTVLSGNVGVPLPSVSAFVMQNGELVMKNGIGELALGGPQLSQGYWNDLTRTRERFVWNERLQTALYMTGDIVRQLNNGSFEFVGRTDDLIKIQGIRIELSEIAFVLRSSHPQVQHVEVLFIQRPDRPSKVIVAFLAAPALSVENSSIIYSDRAIEVSRTALEVARTELPEYMIPKVFLVVGAIPQTSSAKVDRAAMKRLYANASLELWERKSNPVGDDDRVAASLDSRKSIIVESIAHLTGTSKSAMGRQSTLPSIGVDSITATRLITMLDAHNIPVSVVDILECSTLDELFLRSRKQHERSARNSFDISLFHRDYCGFLDSDLADRVELVMPVLPLQESLLSESFQHPKSYWSNNLFILDHQIDLPRLEQAWKHVAQGRDALRTSFCPVADIAKKPPVDMTFLQLIYKNAEVDWTVCSSSECDFETTARDCARLVAERCQEGHFMKPLWAVTIFILESRALMMVSIHHAVRDERSLELIMSDLKSSYLTNHTMRPQQRQQLADAVSLLYTADTNQLFEHEQFWASCLSHVTGDEDPKSWPELKLDSEQNDSGDTITYSWAAERALSDLRARAASIGAVSLAAVLRIAWGCILLEYLETDQLVFGETWSARSEASTLTDIVGPLIFTIPVPFRAQGTLKEMLRYHTHFQTQSKAHYGVHPRKLRKILKGSATGALYPAMFNFVPDASEPSRNDDLALWRRMDDLVELTVEHAIALNAFVSRDNTLRFELTAVKRWTDQEHLCVLARQVDAILGGMIDQPDVHYSQLFNHLPQDLLSLSPVGKDLTANLAWAHAPTEWVDHHASTHPDWPAAEVVSSFDQHSMTSTVWSYEQLRIAYRNVAALIGEFRCTKRMIAVCLDRRLDTYAVVLAIMGTGNTYLPIADDLPRERKSFLLQDSDAVMLFTTRDLSSSISLSCRTVFVEDINFSKPVDMPTNISALPTDGAYLLYTSGSTGTPKGVLVSRGNLASFIEAFSHFISSYIDMRPLQGKGKWLGMASYAFDVHLLEMFFAWRHGMATVTASRYMLLDNLEVALQKLKATHASFVPSLVDNTGLNPVNLPNLRYMSLGGEKISKKAIATWSRSHVVLANAYGPTEVTIGCCFTRVKSATNVRNIGFPLSYTVAHVFRPGTTEYVLRGTSGELCLTGDLIATGYHKRPDAKGFVEDFQEKRMYRTGDKVRLMADGSLEFLGRDDDQTKIRGQRIELGEVSEVVRTNLATITGVNSVETTCLIIQHRSIARPQLVAFVAVHENPRNDPIGDPNVVSFVGGETTEEVRARCRDTLPSFMVPEHFIRLTSLPLMPTSRKVDNKRLQIMFNEISLEDLISSGRQKPSSSSVVSEAESAARSIAAKVLAVDQARINANSNLFHLGLDSLNVISLTLQLQKSGFDSSVSKILKGPTVREIALRLDKKVENGRTTLLPSRCADLEQKIKANNRNGLDLSNLAAVKPCLPLQETLVASSLDGEGEALYVNHVILQLSPDVDHQRLIRAWIMTAEDHDILRTCFAEIGNHIVQLILRDSPLPYDRLYLRDPNFVFSSLRQRESDIASQIIADIECRPPIRLTLATSHGKEQGGMLLISLHHALYDAESFSMLLDEVYGRYESQILPGVRTSIAALIDFVELQNQQDMRAFWTEYLKGYTPMLLTSSTERNQLSSTSRELLAPLSEIEHLAALLNGTSASVMQALFGIVLAETLGTDDILFGAVLSGRTVPVENAHSILAPCITTVPQRVRIDHSQSIQSIIQSAQEGFAESIEHQHTALRAIHRWIEAEGPLFDSLFTYARKRGEPEWSHLWREVESSMSSGFPLAVEIVADQKTNRLVCRCNFSAAFGTAERASLLLKRLESLARSLIQGKDVALKKSLVKDSEVRFPKDPQERQWTKEEIVIKDIVLETVAVSPDSITRDTTFFALGIDSVIAIKFAKKLRQHGVQTSSANIMRYPSVRRLAQHIKITEKRDLAAPKSTEPCQIAADPRQDPTNDTLKTYPCTPLQSSMLTQTLGSDTSVYLHHHGIRLLADDDAPKVKRVWEDIVTATEILRTSFHFSKDTSTWSGTVSRQPFIKWNEWDHSIGMEQAFSRIRRDFVFREESDFSRPPFAVNVVGDIFVLSLHHSLYDGESISILFHDFWALLRGSRLPTRPPFSQAAEEINESNYRAEKYWISSLGDFEGDTSSSSFGTFHEARATLKTDLTTVLEGCRSLGVTLQSLALLAFGKTLAKLSRQDDVTFGHVVRGRILSMSEADNIIGPLFNTVPIRVNLQEMRGNNRDAVQRIQRLTGESQAYQHASLSKVHQAWRKTICNPDAELFRSLFVFQKRLTIEEDQPWESVAVDDDSVPTEYSINFECEQKDSEINICVNSTSIDDLDNFLQTFERLLYDIYQCPDGSPTAVLDGPPMQGGSLPNPQLSSSSNAPKPSNPLDADDLFDTVRRLFSEVTGIATGSISDHASIFSLGLDSISAIQVATVARKEGLKLTVADVLQGRTVKGICQRLNQTRKDMAIGGEMRDDQANSPVAVSDYTPTHTLPSGISNSLLSRAISLAGLRDDDVEGVSACLPGQYYHLLAWLKSGRTLSEGIWTYTCRRALNVQQLLSAWRRLRERHTILRTAFVATSQTEVMQVVLKPSAIRTDALQIIDHTSARDINIGQAIRQEASRRFDLSNPPVELILIRGRKTDYVILKLHHALYDAWTIEKLIQDLSSLYNGTCLPAILGGSSLTQNLLYTMCAESSRAYWLKSLKGYQETILRSTHQLSQASSRDYFFVNDCVPGLSQLESKSRRCDTSLPTVILVSFARKLAQYTAVRSPIFGLYQTGRSSAIEGLDTSCLPCLNVTPLMVREAARRDEKTNIAVLQSDLSARVPFEQSNLRDIFEWIGWGQKPLLNTFVNILWGAETGAEADGNHMLLVPWTGEDATEIVPDYRVPGSNAVEKLDTSLLADENFFLDVQSCPSEDLIRLVARCDYQVLGEDEAKAFVRQICQEIARSLTSGG